MLTIDLPSAQSLSTLPPLTVQTDFQAVATPEPESLDLASKNKYVIHDDRICPVEDFDELSTVRVVTGFDPLTDSFFGKVWEDDELRAAYGGKCPIHDPNVLIESLDDTLTELGFTLPQRAAETMAETLDDDAFRLAY